MTRQQFVAVLAIVLATSSYSNAELPPGSYNELRIKADDAVVIEVVSVTSVIMGNTKENTVEAKILSVERSKSGLKKGEKVTIKYSVPLKPVIGPRPITELKKGEVYPAFLRHAEGKVFEPAAYGESFKATPEPSPTRN